MTRIAPRFEPAEPQVDQDLFDRFVDAPATQPTLHAVADVTPVSEATERRLPAAGRTPVAVWSRTVVRRLVLADLLCAVVAVAFGFAVELGFGSLGAAGTYLSVSVVVAIAWLATLYVLGAYEIRRIMTGTSEYQRVLRAGATLLGAVAVVCYLQNVVVGRAFVAIVIPTGAALMLVSRFVLRGVVARRRRRGDWSSTILAVGTSESVEHLATLAARKPESGLVVVGACVEDAVEGSELAPGVPVVGAVADAAALAEKYDVDVVAVAGSGLGPRRIRELGWALEGTRRNMVMAPGLTEVAGPRVHVSPVDGLPLMWVDQPQFTGARRIVKRMVDLVGAGLALVVAAPFLLLLALAVRITSRGPAIYRSTRVGTDGREFTVYKFRSMFVDAETRKTELLGLNEQTGSLLFKMRKDPRVTRVGAFIRKFSLDELPQLLNVVNGTMSLVGPRPPLPEEVANYAVDVHRRMLVKPGLTGLWQVSGRSDLSWDEAVRLDLFYVENWSLTFDFAIIARTVWAVLARRGAY